MPRDRKPPGTASPSRTDRNHAAVQAPRVAPGSAPHGQGVVREEQQRQMPLPDENARFEQALSGLAGMAGGAGGLAAPSQRPGEPVTAGLSVGAGPGPESLAAGRPRGPDPAVLAAAKWLPMLEAHAANPGTSATFRQWVRTLRSQLPPDLDPATLLGRGA